MTSLKRVLFDIELGFSASDALLLCSTSPRRLLISLKRTLLEIELVLTLFCFASAFVIDTLNDHERSTFVVGENTYELCACINMLMVPM